MANVVTSLGTTLTAETLSGAFGAVIPFLAIIVPVAIGVYYLRKLIKGAGKARVRI